MKQRFFLTFPQQILGEPLIYTLTRDYDVVPNIQGASITEQTGMMALELTGEPDCIERAVAYLRSRNVAVDRIAPEDQQG
jgi:ABC-type methionine transport system ATPase subunit